MRADFSLSRRSVVIGVAFSSCFVPPAPATPEITSKAALQIAVGAGADTQQMEIGLYDSEAPVSCSSTVWVPMLLLIIACLHAWQESAKLFRGLCDGSLSELPGVTYRGSIATRVEKDKAILLGRPPSGSAQEIERSIDGTGYVRSQLVNRAERYANNDSNDLKHDRPGVVSMQRGGGSFEFTIAPKANPALDSDNVVIGQVLLDEGDGRELLTTINQVPVRQPKAETSLYGAVAKAAGDPRTRVETVYRPLRKVSISRCDMR